MTTSFADLQQWKIEDWNNADTIKVSNNPQIVPLLIARGNSVKHDFKIHERYRGLVYTQSEIITAPTIETDYNTATAKWDVEMKANNYYAFTSAYIIQAKAGQPLTMEAWNTPVNDSLSHLNLQYERDSYLGDGLNKGLISDVVANTTDLTYSTANQLFEKIVGLAGDFNSANGNNIFAPVVIWVSGDVAKAVRGSYFNNSTLTVEEALIKQGIMVMYTSSLVNATNRVDFTDLGLLNCSHGLPPQVMKKLTTTAKTALTDDYHMAVGYQSVSIFKKKPTAVMSYLKA
jgi:hypothetical protein